MTQRAVAHNLRAIDAAIGAPQGAPSPEEHRSGVSWLPLFHDMGLVGCLLTAMAGGIDLVLAPPRSFLGRPQSWLAALGRAGPSTASISAAPNFAYQTCVERVDPGSLEGCDLSRWRAALMGAEMIRPDAVEAFCERFAPLGFAPRAVRACYGMAETTLALTFDQAGVGLRTRALPPSVTAAERGLAGERVACVGTPVVDSEIVVVTPDGAPAPDGGGGGGPRAGTGGVRGLLERRRNDRRGTRGRLAPHRRPRVRGRG